jgi:hypothetical protein
MTSHSAPPFEHHPLRVTVLAPVVENEAEAADRMRRERAPLEEGAHAALENVLVAEACRQERGACVAVRNRFRTWVL